MNISTDHIIFWQGEWFRLNGTIVYSWLVMTILLIGSYLVTKKLAVKPPLSRWQTTVEIITIG